MLIYINEHIIKNKDIYKIVYDLDLSNKIVDSSKRNKQELKYNQHGFPSYRPIIEHDKESNKRHIKY